ncbi:MAG TPA: hypothetical protein VJT81_00660 [Burkholderiales bacterium]|nr:hypothetical protein [Burkholderiales bacterium]
MTDKIKFVAEQAVRNPLTDRMDLMEDLLAKLADDDQVRTAVWADRLAAYDPGEIEAFDVDDEVMGQLGLQYGRA